MGRFQGRMTVGRERLIMKCTKSDWVSEQLLGSPRRHDQLIQAARDGLLPLMDGSIGQAVDGLN